MGSILSPVEPLIWKYNPWKDKPRTTWAVFLIDCAVVGLVGYCYQNDQAILLFLLLTALVMFGMTLSLLTPIGYRMDNEGVTVEFLGTRSIRPWGHYRNLYVHSNGIFLTSMKRPSGLDPFRGHFLYFQAKNHDQVTLYARRHINSQS